MSPNNMLTSRSLILSVANKVLVFILSCFFLVYASSVLFNSAFEWNEIHSDEIDTIERSILFPFTFPNTHDSKWTRDEAFDQPLLSYYLYGLTAKYQQFIPLAQARKCEPYSGAINKHLKSYSIPHQYISLNSLPDSAPCALQQIRAMRVLAVFLSLATLCIIILIGKYLLNTLAGLFAALLFLTNDVFLTCMTRAMGDPLLIFFFALHLLLSLYFIQNNVFIKSRKSIYLFVCINIASGLAIATKLNGSLLIVSFLCIVMLLGAKYEANFKIIFLYLTVSLIVNFDIFLALNPFIWPAPIQNSIKMATYRLSNLAANSVTNNPDTPGLLTFPNRISLVMRNVLLPHGAFSTFKQLPLDLLFFCIGLYILIKGVLKTKRGLYFIVWSIPVVVVTTLRLYVDWNRYYLPIIMVTKIIQSIGIVYIARSGLHVISTLTTRMKKYPQRLYL